VNENNLRQLLLDIQNKRISIDIGVDTLRKLPFQDLDFARIDSHRGIRSGFPEVVLCSGKSISHIVAIMEKLTDGPGPVLATRATEDIFSAVNKIIPQVEYREQAKAIIYQPEPIPKRPGIILVLAAGTADLPVAEEAAVTADIMGNQVEKIYDVGVAGIHRLFAHLDKIMMASVLIVVAGMDGALPSVVGGLVNKPVIAVPTSIGYGASFGGLAALLTMLNSCAAGVTVVNIDNGFGAGYAASQINALKD
jgi:pyridinium-3,5-biscarboxylic acid mononucleotide synthase